MTFTRSRRRHIDTTGHFCPHTTCSYHGRVGWGNIRATLLLDSGVVEFEDGVY
jgi:hypothetical protein